jgi:methanogenic corrinoid protein MtbC1
VLPINLDFLLPINPTAHTVKGDLYDIGKNLVAMMFEGAGYRVIDLGTGVWQEV